MLKRPTFKYYNFIKLFPLCFVHIHYDHARFRLNSQIKMSLNKRTPNNF